MNILKILPDFFLQDFQNNVFFAQISQNADYCQATLLTGQYMIVQFSRKYSEEDSSRISRQYSTMLPYIVTLLAV